MSVEFVPTALVAEIMRRVQEARSLGASATPLSAPNSTEYWQEVFEANAAAVLSALSRVELTATSTIRYCFYGRQGGDLLVRPFVARAGTDVSVIRPLIDWHPAPDSLAPSNLMRGTQDVEFLYRHFTFDRSPVGYFEYWVAMQELWASARWVHSRVIADAMQFEATTTGEDWQVEQKLERYEPAVVMEADGGAQLAVLLYGRLEAQLIALQRIQIAADQDLRLLESIPVAQGPRGYLVSPI